MKILQVDFQEAHWLHNALAREGMDITDVTVLLDRWEDEGGLYDELRTIVVTRREVAALRLYLARIQRPDISAAVEARCNTLFPPK